MSNENLPSDRNGIIVEEQPELTLIEVSNACAVEVAWVIELVEEGVLEPRGEERSDWRFPAINLRRAIAARRLQRDLGLNIPGVALALELLQEIEHLKARLTMLDTE